jgi:hypothetical protein
LERTTDEQTEITRPATEYEAPRRITEIREDDPETKGGSKAQDPPF